jgi:predicted RNase H-like HicB family nuclease
MTNTFAAVTKQDGDCWIGWIEEVPGVNCQERSREELIERLKVTLKEALEFDRQGG